MESRLNLSIKFRLFDCGHQIGCGVLIGTWRRAWRVRNPFKISLSNEDFYAGRNRWRWPVSMWAKA